MNTTIKRGFAALLLLAISCTKDNLKSSSTITSRNLDQSAAGHWIGQHYAGGVIFYIDSTGQHGLIADTADFRKLPWWNGRYTITGATKTGIGSGKSNTDKIILSQGDSGKYAARKCSNSKR
ncbi:MAG TPA: hypothetical protein VEV83_11380, partial [Parafilimonas sp.]|nr:hypothetical protein [Parafilimonas sp.]